MCTNNFLAVKYDRGTSLIKDCGWSGVLLSSIIT